MNVKAFSGYATDVEKAITRFFENPEYDYKIISITSSHSQHYVIFVFVYEQTLASED